MTDRMFGAVARVTEKRTWSGKLVSVQPRIRLNRSFDQRTHSYLGYCLLLQGIMDGVEGQYSIGIGKAAQQRRLFQAGDEVSGVAVAVPDERREPVGFYRASKLKVLARRAETGWEPPPWWGVPPDLETYRERGHRRLSARTYAAKCQSCIWGCRMAVEMLIDPWNPSVRYRYETFCYGPKSCPWYRPGPRRVVPGRKGMRWEEPDWVDDEATAHRGPHE